MSLSFCLPEVNGIVTGKNIYEKDQKEITEFFKPPRQISPFTYNNNEHYEQHE